jgi:hypothetical protein
MNNHYKIKHFLILFFGNAQIMSCGNVYLVIKEVAHCGN